MKRSGPTPWTWKVAAPRPEAIRLAVETGRETPREMFVRFDVQRFTRFGTFRRFVSEQRRINRGRESSPAPAAESGAAAAPDNVHRYRGRWGTRGVARLRKIGMVALDDPQATAVAWASLLDAADSLRLIADRLAEVAQRFGPERPILPVTKAKPTSDEVGNTGTPGGDDCRQCADGEKSTDGVARAGSQSKDTRG